MHANGLQVFSSTQQPLQLRGQEPPQPFETLPM